MKVAVVIGENAGGKTNFINSLSYLKSMFEDTKAKHSYRPLINVNNLKSGCPAQSNTKQEFDICIIGKSELIYHYNLQIDEFCIVEEKLTYRSKKSNQEKVVIHVKREQLNRMEEKKMNSQQIEGRNAVMEAFRSGKPIDKVYILDGCQDGPIRSIVREAKKHDTILNFVTKERLNQISETGRHQGVIAQAAAYEYAQVEDMLELAKQKGEDPFLILLDNIEDPHNLGAIIRTANLAGAHGVIIPKHRAAGLTATVAKTSAGALNYTPVAKVTNLVKTMEELKEKGLWFVCADMDGDVMYRVNLKGPIGLVIGNEGEGVGRLVKETCDMTASIPMKGDIDSLNASVAAGILAYEIVRQRMS